ncbi:hypothetical protein AZSI13_10570 [Azospira sp. I13]|uniref:energy transducer TonB n=1 Tax=Azospira sp. I13 TaxID=1765050 RepID=UPI000D485A11|nr:energy transducer TonB [Azospira sp. I13]GBG01730.1 hypothetical protein AZSI13_10570 [Azospira sp. I13]
MRFHRLHAALLCSAALHGALLALPPAPAKPVPAVVRLEARLRPPPATPAQRQEAPPEAKPTPPEPEQKAPPAKPQKPPKPEKPSPAKPAPVRFKEPPATFNGYPVLSGGAARYALNQLGRQPLYPQEAIDLGLQGEVLLLLFLDGAGNVLAARVERSSGHALLDQAAAKAARQLKALPEGVARETILPVRFRLD